MSVSVVMYIVLQNFSGKYFFYFSSRKGSLVTVMMEFGSSGVAGVREFGSSGVAGVREFRHLF